MSDDPFSVAITAAIAAYILYLWGRDYRSYAQGQPSPRELPGARPAPAWLLWLAAGVSVLIVLVETGLEYALGVSAEQSDVHGYYLIAMVAAGVVEELLFRGFLLVQHRGRAALWGSVAGFSALFALLHMHFLVEDDAGGYSLGFGTGPVLWTSILFVNSLWWYAVRLMPANRHRSLLPCFVGHIASNLAVFSIKLAQGHVLFP